MPFDAAAQVARLLVGVVDEFAYQRTKKNSKWLGCLVDGFICLRLGLGDTHLVSCLQRDLGEIEPWPFLGPGQVSGVVCGGAGGYT